MKKEKKKYEGVIKTAPMMNIDFSFEVEKSASNKEIKRAARKAALKKIEFEYWEADDE